MAGENDFWQKVPYGYAYTLFGEKFVEIALSRTTEEIDICEKT